MNTLNKINTTLLFYSVFLFIGFFLVACGGGKEKSSSTDELPLDKTKVLTLDEIEVGSCITPVNDSAFLDKLVISDCSQEHMAEFAGVTTIDAGDNAADMGHLEITRQAYKDCQPVFEGYTGQTLWESDYDIETISPSVTAWRTGDREVMCLVVGMGDTPLMQSAAK